MKNKGFTLIELLAVIVILAIIALIATPIILGIINDARESARERSAELVKTGVQYAYTRAWYNTTGNATVGVITAEDVVDALDIDNLDNTYGTKGVKYTADDDSFLIKTNDSVYCKVTVGHSDNTGTSSVTIGCSQNETNASAGPFYYLGGQLVKIVSTK